MLYVVWALWQSLAVAAGVASNSNVLKAGPYMIVAVFVIGLVYAIWLRQANPAVYAEIGRTVMDDAHERADEPVEPAAPSE
jgi:hypothetical protein